MTAACRPLAVEGSTAVIVVVQSDVGGWLRLLYNKKNPSLCPRVGARSLVDHKKSSLSLRVQTRNAQILCFFADMLHTYRSKMGTNTDAPSASNAAPFL